MGNELEDFLKRAAQRRAEHIAVRGEQQQREQQRAMPARAPEYTDRNRERMATLVEDDEEVFVAEVVPSGLAGQPAYTSGLADRHLSTLAESSAVDQAYAPTSHQTPSNYETRASWNEPGQQSGSSGQAGQANKPQGNASASALVKLLKSPNGVRQAFLMREILDRPANRW